jgi:hypothetical protein
VAHQDASHHLSGDSEEVRPILPAYLVLVDESEVNLAHQGRGLEGMSRPFPAEKTGRLAVQLFIDQREQRLQCLRIAGAARDQPLRHLSLGRRCRSALLFGGSRIWGRRFHRDNFARLKSQIFCARPHHDTPLAEKVTKNGAICRRPARLLL